MSLGNLGPAIASEASAGATAPAGDACGRPKSQIDTILLTICIQPVVGGVQNDKKFIHTCHGWDGIVRP
jgi:hypothetical protein